MAISVLFNGVIYSIPQTGEESWGDNLTSFFTAIPQGALQKTGGNFTLTADVNFGANFGLLSKYFSARTANPSTVGVVRLAVTDSVGWRNNANNANLLLAVDGSNNLTFNGTIIQNTISIGALDAQAANSSGLALVSAVLSSQSADATHPGMVNITAQTFAGVKTFSSAPVLSALTPSQVVVTDAGRALGSLAYASANTASSLVERDGSGNFAAGTITASLTGTASGNTTITPSNHGVVISGSANAMTVIAPDASTTKSLISGGASADPAWALLVNANLSGSAGITNANLAVMASASTTAGTVKGNISGSSATPSDIALASANTVSSVVYRDSSGNFAAGTITAALTGTASGNTTISPSQYGVVLSGSANILQVLAPDASTAKVLLSGGSSANPTWSLLTNSNLSGSAGITNANLATMVTATVKGNISGSTGTPTDVSLVSAATASTVMFRDTNANTNANNVSSNYATAVTAAGTTVLTVASARNQYFTGSTTQNVQLPDATTLPQTGFQFFIVNLSSGVVTIKDAGSNTIQALPASSWAWVTAKSIGSANGSWDVQYGTNNAGGGTVTSVAMTVPTALFASSPVSGSPVTTSGTLAPTLATQTAGTFFAGPTSGSAATPTFRALQAPTVQKFTAAPTGATNYAFTITSGNTAAVGATFTNNGQTFTLLAALLVGDTILYCSGTGTPAASGTLTYASGTHTGGNITFSAYQGCYILASGTLYIRVRMVGGGGGGTGSGTAGGTSPTAGGNSLFGSSLLSANGGSALAWGNSTVTSGGSASLGSGPVGIAISGGQGGGCGFMIASGSSYAVGGHGGNSALGGGGGMGGGATVGGAAAANSGSGGGGAGTGNNANTEAGPGGGAGGFVDAIITSPSPFYSWSCGSAGSAGAAGTNGFAGGAGAAGLVEVTEYYQ